MKKQRVFLSYVFLFLQQQQHITMCVSSLPGTNEEDDGDDDESEDISYDQGRYGIIPLLSSFEKKPSCSFCFVFCFLFFAFAVWRVRKCCTDVK